MKITHDWQRDLDHIVYKLNGDNEIDLYLLEHESNHPYGACYGKPLKIGRLSSSDIHELIKSKRFIKIHDTLDYWYSLEWVLPKGCADISISISPNANDGIQLNCKKWNEDSIITLENDKLHKKILNMLIKSNHAPDL